MPRFSKLGPPICVTAFLLFGSGCRQQTIDIEQAPSREINLVVYSENFGQVRESRKVDLHSGLTSIDLAEISKQLDPSSVYIRFPNQPDVETVSNTYNSGTSDTRQLLSRFLGKPITLRYYDQAGSIQHKESGILQVADGNQVVVLVHGKYLVNPPATIEVADDQSVLATPHLSIDTKCSTAKPGSVELNYLTEGLSWHADYTAILLKSGDSMNLELWASVSNETGTAFPKAHLTFVSGTPNRAARSRFQKNLADQSGFRPEPMGKSYEVHMKEMVVGELYAFPFQSTASIEPGQTNRVKMSPSKEIRIRKDYAIRLPAVSFDGLYSSVNEKIKATLSVNWNNTNTDSTSTPLPSGTVRFYEKDANDSLTYIGASTIENTPLGARVSQTLSEVFDVSATAKTVKREKVGKSQIKQTVEIEVTNSKQSSVEVRLVQSFEDRASIINESIKGKNLDSQNREWTVTVPAGAKQKLAYVATLSR